MIHEPVLLEKVLALLDVQEGETVLDGTLGAGGYAQAILERLGEKGRLIVLDRDPEAIQKASDRFKNSPQVTFCQVNYSEFEKALESQGVSTCDKMVLDLGLSRDQLLDPARGFSFAESGPLDMRMSKDENIPTLAELLSTISEKDLADLIYKYGEEHFSRRISKAILEAQRHHVICTTAELAQVIQRAVSYRRGRLHPATRSFQAFRIAVNQELEHLGLFLEKFPARLRRSGGRLGIVAFHSLEDRMVKERFKALSSTSEFRLVNKKAEKADIQEIRKNPSARSARLRVIERN